MLGHKSSRIVHKFSSSQTQWEIKPVARDFSLSWNIRKHSKTRFLCAKFYRYIYHTSFRNKQKVCLFRTREFSTLKVVNMCGTSKYSQRDFNILHNARKRGRSWIITEWSIILSDVHNRENIEFSRSLAACVAQLNFVLLTAVSFRRMLTI